MHIKIISAPSTYYIWLIRNAKFIKDIEINSIIL